jgi:hypothetical protein
MYSLWQQNLDDGDGRYGLPHYCSGGCREGTEKSVEQVTVGCADLAYLVWLTGVARMGAFGKHVQCKKRLRGHVQPSLQCLCTCSTDACLIA